MRKTERFPIRDVLKNIGTKSIFAFVLVFLMIFAATCVSGYLLYSTTKTRIHKEGEVNVLQSAKEFDKYLLTRKNAVMLVGHVVDRMLLEGKSQSSILNYLISESNSVQASIDKEITGFYGWLDSEYYDGGGWVPDEDYVPTKRPWYIETIADNSDITFVRPYLDDQTHTIMTTIAQQLSDGVSVVAMDVSLQRIQEITQEIAQQTQDCYGIVLDKTGQVIAHSDESELGKNYLEEKGTLYAALAGQLFSREDNQFELRYAGMKYMVYAENIEGGWKAVTLIAMDTFYGPLETILIMWILLTLLEAVVFIVIFYNMSAKNLAISIQNVEIGAIADMYMDLYDIDLKSDSIRYISGRKYDTELTYTDKPRGAQSILNEMYDRHVDEMSKPVMDPFVDLTTLPQRLEQTDTVTEEFLNDKKLWCRGRFVVAARDPGGHVVRALWMIESIDEEKKRRDNLKALSETDRMTGLYNRVAGENKIQELINHGQGGMLILLDVDKFKNINDGFGHTVGDQVLIALSNTLTHVFRGSDIIMRLGGDEFVTYTPGVFTQEKGNRIIRRLFKSIQTLGVEALGDYPVTVSVGAAFCSNDTVIPFGVLYKHVDACAYQSKKATGNAVTFFTGPVGEQ